MVLTACGNRAIAASQYWDGNGATGGAGTTPAGTWGSDDFWSSDPAGGAATGTWTPG
ncbi:MAG: hypothetical protein QOE14_2423, partial [Humisphaera sp.]|nr:hypothetical protein [Humisphaera sp.]